VAIGEEAAKAVAVFCDVGKGLAQGRLCRGAGAVVGQPIVETGDDRSGAVPPDGQSRHGVTAADLGLDGVEVADEGHAFLGVALPLIVRCRIQ
jgi:hypothetical protein